MKAAILSALQTTTAENTSAREDLRQVHEADLAAAAAQAAADIHQAPGVGRDDDVGACLLDERRLVLHHGAADAGIAHGKGAAEAAAFIRALERDVLESLDAPEEPLGLVLQA